jgi:hypothetical protein
VLPREYNQSTSPPPPALFPFFADWWMQSLHSFLLSHNFSFSVSS